MKKTLRDRSSQNHPASLLFVDLGVRSFFNFVDNGGDGLVAARHLKLFGYSPTVFYPKPTPKEIYSNLVVQAKGVGVPFVDSIPADHLASKYDLVLDSIFGFSFDP